MRIDDVASSQPSITDCRAPFGSCHVASLRLTPRVGVRYAQCTLGPYPLPKCETAGRSWTLSEVTPRVAKDYAQRSLRPRRV